MNLTFDPAQSSLRIETVAKGMLAKLAHDLAIDAKSLTADASYDGGKAELTLRVPIADLKVYGVRKGDQLAATDEAVHVGEQLEAVTPVGDRAAMASGERDCHRHAPERPARGAGLQAGSCGARPLADAQRNHGGDEHERQRDAREARKLAPAGQRQTFCEQAAQLRDDARGCLSPRRRRMRHARTIQRFLSPPSLVRGAGGEK